MTATGRQRLQALLDEPPPALDGLDDQALGQLADLIAHARTAQQTALRQALEGALRHIPAILRGTVRRMLFPESRG